MSEPIKCFACNEELTPETTFTVTNKDNTRTWLVHPEPCLQGLQAMLARVYGTFTTHYPEIQDGTAIVEIG